MGNFVIIKNCFRKDLFKHYIKSFTDNHLLLLVYMQRFEVINRCEINFCMNWLFEDLEINKSSTRKELINALFELVDMKLVELIDDVDRDRVNKNTRIRTYAIEYKDNFTKIYDTEIDKILDSNIDFRMKKTMLFLYCDIASRIDKKGYCYPSFESFKSDLDTVSDSRINDSLSELKKNRLIDYDNAGQIIVNKQVTQSNNVYVLCCDKDYKDILAKALSNRKQQYVKNKVTVVKKKQSNLQKSIAMKLNNRRAKFQNNTISDNELKELEQLEKQYYELIKDTELKEERLSEFVLFKPVDTKKIDTETGEILENDEEEININSMINSLFDEAESDTTALSQKNNNNKEAEAEETSVLQKFGNLSTVKEDNKQKTERIIAGTIQDFVKRTEFDTDIVKDFINNIEFEDKFYNAAAEEQQKAIRELLFENKDRIEFLHLKKQEEEKRNEEMAMCQANYVTSFVYAEDMSRQQEQEEQTTNYVNKNVEFINNVDDELLSLLS